MRALSLLTFFALAGCYSDLDELQPGGSTGSCRTMPDAGNIPTWAQIQADIDNPAIITATINPQPTGGCSSSGDCHQSGSGAAVLKLTPNATGAALEDNYNAFTKDAQAGVDSLVLTKNLKGSSESHSGGKNFEDTSNAIYQRWLLWIRACNPR